MPGPNSPYTKLDYNQVIQQVYDEAQDRLRTDATFSGTIDAELEVEVDAADGDNIALANEDGSKKVTVTTVGSKEALDVNVVNSSDSAGTLNTFYNEITSLGSGSLTTIGGFTALGDSKLLKISVSGTNIASYQVELNASVIDKRRTYFGNSLNTDFIFETGLDLGLGDNVVVKVIHDRPDVGDFNARIDIEE